MDATAAEEKDRISRLLARWPASRRLQVASVVALVAIVVATLIASSRLLRLVSQELDLLAYLGLFAACWIGAGGALVPVPGVRPVSWFMIVQQGAALDPAVVALVAALAMVLGQTSYFVATRASRRNGTASAPEDPDPAAADPVLPDVAVLLAPDQPDPAPATPVVVSRRAAAMAGARSRVRRQVNEHGMATVFAVSAVPSPLTSLTTAVAAGSGMGYARFFPASFGGFLVLSTVLVLFGQGLMLALRSVVPFG